MSRSGGDVFSAVLAATSLAGATLTFSSGVEAQAGDPAFREQNFAFVESAEPVVIGRSPQVRLPAFAEAGKILTMAKVKMPGPLAAEHGEFDASATVRLVVGADGSQTNCHVVEARIRRGVRREPNSYQPVSLPLCEFLQQEIRFRPAINADGEPIASTVTTSLSFSRSAPVFGAPPPVLLLAPTPGHILTETGYWADRSHFLYNKFVISEPNWTEALTNPETLPKMARVGVRLKRVEKEGFGTIAACNVVMSSKDARLDAATCKALLSSVYSLKEGLAYVGPDDFPVLVEWNRGKATMTAPMLATVPSMPEDVTLLPRERPAGTPPELRIIPMHIKLDDKGASIGCAVIRSSGNDAWDAAGCRIALKRARFTAPSDSFGAPANGLYEAVADWDAMIIRPGR